MSKIHIIYIRYTIIICMIISALSMRADAYRDYIDRYSGMAIQQMEAYGIPASITLAQGLLESAAGKSTLAREGNNHFGIKCHSEWKGRTMYRNDDLPNECFRAYANVEDSFRDHSLFLRKNRYARLFDLQLTDYKGWARGLKACGYATDPNYAERLISIIELYSLNEMDKKGRQEYTDTPYFITQMLKATHVVRKTDGLHYVIAQPGDTYGKIALELNMSPKKLLEYNDCKKDREIKAWEEVYLQEKRDTPLKDDSKTTIGDGESLHSVAQRYGMKLSVLKRLNPDVKDEPGTVVKLR